MGALFGAFFREKGRLIAALAVHQTLERPPGGVVLQILAEELDVEVAGEPEGHVAGNVRREQEVLRLPQRVIGG